MKIALSALFALLACAAQAAGLQKIDIPADAHGPALQGAVWTPCAAAPAGTIQFGPASLPGTPDCPVLTGPWPLIVISHGSGGWLGAHHDTAAVLANAGFAVAAVNHPGNNAFDMQRVGDMSALVQDRPTDLRRLIDHLLSAWPGAVHISPTRIGLFGFSRGGLGGLIAIGGQPDLRQMQAQCTAAFAPKFGRNACQNPATTSAPHDARIRAAVLADPLYGALFVNGLRGVTVPVQLWASEQGGDGVSLADVQALRTALPMPPDYRTVPAGHFAFIAPCSPQRAKAAPAICTDRAGFDRTSFHQDFNAAVLEFLRQHL